MAELQCLAVCMARGYQQGAPALRQQRRQSCSCNHASGAATRNAAANFMNWVLEFLCTGRSQQKLFCS